MNKNGKIIAGLASFFGLVLLGSVAFGDMYSEEFSGGTVGGTFRTMGWNTYEASWLIGHRVMDTESGTLGQITSVVVDNTNGRIALVVLSDVPGLGAAELAIPYPSITRIDSDTFMFNPGDMVIQAAPTDSPGTFPYQDSVLYTVTQGPSDSEFFGLPPTITAEWVSDVYRHYGQEAYWTMEGGKPLASLELYDSGNLMGARVQTANGEGVAEVNDLVIDSSDGHIAFVVLSDVAGRGGDLVAVPFGALSRTGENTYVLNATQEQLASCASFDEMADLDNLGYAENIYVYFGLQPYWTAEGR